MKSDEILYGVIFGAGFMGETHLKGYQQLSGVEITAIVDPVIERAQKLAGEIGAESYTSLAEAAAKQKLDFVDICTPTPYHVTSIKEAFEFGCHVIVEKPLSAKVDDIAQIRQLVEDSKHRLMVAHVCRFMTPYIYAKKIVESGKLGRLLVFSARRYSEIPGWSKDNWINDNKKTGGILVDLSIHDIDIAQWLLGQPLGFYASEAMSDPQGPSHVFETIEFQGGGIAHIEASQLLPEGYGLMAEYQLIFEKGNITYTFEKDKILVKEFSDGIWQEASHENLAEFSDPYAEEVFHFISGLKSGSDFRISLDEAERAVHSALLLRKSLETGAKVV